METETVRDSKRRMDTEREMWETDRQRKMERETLAERERHIHKETDRDGDMESGERQRHLEGAT